MDLAYKRWVEIQFYFICIDLLKMNNDLEDVMNTIDFICSVYLRSGQNELLKSIAGQVILTNNLKPSRIEYLLVASENKHPQKHIQKRAQLSRQTIYAMLKENEKDPIGFYTRLNETQFIQVEQFVKGFLQFKEVGV